MDKSRKIKKKKNKKKKKIEKNVKNGQNVLNSEKDICFEIRWMICIYSSIVKAFGACQNLRGING
ncbi:MAG: hypothetical protein ISQ46_03880 [Methylophilaceae bacterium]|nr:hypothetical protein [Methylophilaceae bacterium]